MLLVLLAAVLLAGVSPAATGVSVTVPYSATAVGDTDLDGNPGTGAWSDAGSWAIPLENGQSAPYGSATLYAKHDNAYAYFRIDGAIDVAWVSTTADHFWLGAEFSATGTSHHSGSGIWDGVFFGESGYTPAPTYPPAAVDTTGFSKPPAVDATQNDLGRMAYTGSAAPYSFTAEWKRPLNSGDAQDIAFVADGTTTYNFFVSTDSDGGGSSGGAIDHSSVTNLNTLRFATPPSPTVHDVAVTAASATPLSVLQGQAVTISATVQNQGTVAETFEAKASAGSLPVGTQTVTNLAAGASKSLSFTWDTTGVTPAAYPVRVDATAVSGETDLADNTFTDGTVTVAAVVHDVAITAASASPLTALVGATITISATAANQGTQAESFSVSAYAGSILVDTQAVAGLAAGATKSLSFSWGTSSVAPGSYAVHVDAASVPGETDLADNSFSDGTVVLSAVVHDVAVLSASAAPLSATVGATVTISATVQNQGTQAESFSVSAYAGAIAVGTQTVTSLGASSTQSLSFSWNTASAASGSYPIRVDASAVAGETDLADNSYTDGTVVLTIAVVHDVAVTDASAAPLSSPVGTAVTISATVQNQGTQAETFDVKAYGGSLLIGTQAVTGLAAGASQGLSFSWDTSAVAPGSYAIKVEAASVAGETDLADNTFSDGTVSLTAVVHDVAITSASASPLSAIVGAGVTISASAANQGTQAETFAVTAYAGSISVGTQTVTSLAAGASKSLSFSWDTAGVTLGSYPVRVEAAAVTGETDLSDNAFNDGIVVLVAPVHDVAITSADVSPTTGLIGDLFVVTVVAANQGNQAETFDVTALANGVAIGTKSVTLAASASATVTFSWSTAGLSAGDYAISATASAVPGETDLSDNSFSDGTVTLAAPPPATPLLGLGRIWPEWRRAPLGTAQVFYAKVNNLGSVGAFAQVVYDIYEKATGVKVATVSSQVVWVPAGTVVADTAFASNPWNGPQGIYTVVGTLHYGADATNLNITDGTKQISRFVIL